MLCDSHCHFFSEGFFEALLQQRGQPLGPRVVKSALQELGWTPPGAPEELASRWVAELDRAGVSRAALIASVGGDEGSVATAVAHAPDRFVGLFIVDPTSPDSVERVRRGLTELGLRGICLYPAMHRYSLDDPRVHMTLDVVAAQPGRIVFVHCGMLSIGVRKRLGLPSPFDPRRGDPLGVAALALRSPSTTFIIPHFGAGFFREALMAADLCSNVHLDTSSSNSWTKYLPGLTLDDVFKQTIAAVGPERLVFGTDSSFFPRGWQRPIYEAQRAVLARIGVSEKDQALIFGGNFDRIFPALSGAQRRAARRTATRPAISKRASQGR